MVPSRVTTSVSAISTNAATHASPVVIWWAMLKRATSSAPPWSTQSWNPIRAPMPSTHRIAETAPALMKRSVPTLRIRV